VEQVATLQTGPVATQRVLNAATSVAASPVQIAEATVTSAELGEAAVTLTNVSSQSVDLSGWTLLISSFRATLPNNQYMTLLPAQKKTIHLTGAVPGSDPTSGDNIYVGASSIRSGAGMLTEGNKVVLVNPQAEVASTYQLPPP
jgi:hypothetical protein